MLSLYCGGNSQHLGQAYTTFARVIRGKAPASYYSKGIFKQSIDSPQPKVGILVCQFLQQAKLRSPRRVSVEYEQAPRLVGELLGNMPTVGQPRSYGTAA